MVFLRRHPEARALVLLTLLCVNMRAMPVAAGRDAAAATTGESPAAKETEAEQRKSVLVMDLKSGAGITDDNAFVMTQEIATVLAQDKRLRVQTMEDSRVTLGVEAQKQLLGCTDSSCLAEIAQAMGTDTLLFGRLDRIGDQVTLQLTLLSSEAEPLARLSAKDADVASILGRIDTIVVEVKNTLNPPSETDVDTGISPLLIGGAAGIGVGLAAALGGGVVATIAFLQMADSSAAAKTRDNARTFLFWPGSVAFGLGVVVTAGGAAVAGLGLSE